MPTERVDVIGPDQQVLWFQVSVEDASSMTVCNGVEELM
jgi:hypothetical protein